MSCVHREIRWQFHHRNRIARRLFASVDANGTGKLGDDDFFSADGNTVLLSAALCMAFEVFKGLRIRFHLVLVDDNDASKSREWDEN